VGYHQAQRFLHGPTADYSLTAARSLYNEQPRHEDEAGSKYYEERRPYQTNERQRDFENPEARDAGYSQEHNEYDKSYSNKYGSDESLAKSPSYQTAYPSEDKGSFEETEEASGERDPKYYQETPARPQALGRQHSHTDGKFATSYQSVTFETHQQHPVPVRYTHTAQPQPH